MNDVLPAQVGNVCDPLSIDGFALYRDARNRGALRDASAAQQDGDDEQRWCYSHDSCSSPRAAGGHKEDVEDVFIHAILEGPPPVCPSLQQNQAHRS
jgi:hypothetical protein